MKITFRRAAGIAIMFLLAISITFFGLKRYNTKAEAKSFTITSLDDYKAYESLDRDQAILTAEAQKLKIQYDQDTAKKMAIRKRLGVPDDYVEKREQVNDPQSPVIGFVPPPSAPKQ